MIKSEAQKLAGDKYADHGTLTYLGNDRDHYFFGFMDTDEITTLEEPFYIDVTDDGVAEHLSPVFEDDAVQTSAFGALERRYKFYEKAGLYDE